MATKIEWTDETWNPVVGCSPVSPGCANCYAARIASGRLRHLPRYHGMARNGRWTGEVRALPYELEKPLRWKKPRRVFVCSMGDLFHDEVMHKTRAAVFGVMAHCSRHTFQVLTKRTITLFAWHAYLEMMQGQAAAMFPNDSHDWRRRHVLNAAALRSGAPVYVRSTADKWPLPNVWLGVSAEDQARANERISLLLASAAAVRWVSVEPMLGPVDLRPHLDGLDWVVCGAETGPGARLMDPEWARNLRDQCKAAGVPFFMKQMSGREPIPEDLKVREWPAKRGTGSAAA